MSIIGVLSGLAVMLFSYYTDSLKGAHEFKLTALLESSVDMSASRPELEGIYDSKVLMVDSAYDLVHHVVVGQSGDTICERYNLQFHD
ncbi:MAG: hypothetical protein RLP15_07180 [Cryomorphaceae bacterium]